MHAKCYVKQPFYDFGSPDSDKIVLLFKNSSQMKYFKGLWGQHREFGKSPFGAVPDAIIKFKNLCSETDVWTDPDYEWIKPFDP